MSEYLLQMIGIDLVVYCDKQNSVNRELEEFAAQTVGLNPLSYGKSVIH